MAGPKGGAPRRSHTKSRDGCGECKKRHLRCDETFPQCTNCTKHRTRCPYNLTDRSEPDMLETDEINAQLDAWANGVFPYPAMPLPVLPNPADYSRPQLRLLLSVLESYNNLLKNDAVKMSLWAEHLPKIFMMGASASSVMYALMSFAAWNMANRTNCPLVGQLGLEYKSTAMSNILEASRGPVTNENLETIIATSMILSWRADEWSTWYPFMKGVVDATRNLVPDPLEPASGLLHVDIRLFTQLPDLVLSERRPRAPTAQALARWKEAQASLQKLLEQLKQRKKSSKLVKQLLDLVEGMGKVPTYRSAEDQFHRLRNLRMWVFWLPATMFDSDWTVDDLVAMAYYYATAILTSDLCPEIGSIQLALDSMDPIARIVERVFLMNSQHNGEFTQQCEQLEFPQSVLNGLRENLESIRPSSSSGMSSFGLDINTMGHMGGGDLGSVVSANQLLHAPFAGTPPTYNPVSPSLSVYPPASHNSPVTPVFSPATGHSPQSYAYDHSPVTPVMSVFSPHGHGGSPMANVPPPVSSLRTQDSPLTPGGASPYFHTPDSGYQPRANFPRYIKTEPYADAPFGGPVQFGTHYLGAHDHIGGSTNAMAGFPPGFGSGSPNLDSSPMYEAHPFEETRPVANSAIYGDEQRNVVADQWLGGPLF